MNYNPDVALQKHNTEISYNISNKFVLINFEKSYLLGAGLFKNYIIYFWGVLILASPNETNQNHYDGVRWLGGGMWLNQS